MIDFGPGYRMYFGKDGDKVVVLLAGGTKKRQDSDVTNAKERWQDYKQRKKSEKMKHDAHKKFHPNDKGPS